MGRMNAFKPGSALQKMERIQPINLSRYAGTRHKPQQQHRAAKHERVSGVFAHPEGLDSAGHRITVEAKLTCAGPLVPLKAYNLFFIQRGHLHDH